MDDCIFCKIVHKKIPAKIIFENEHLLAFRDTDPKAPVHLLLIPKRHVESLLALGAEDSAWWSSCPNAIREIAKMEKVEKSGFRVVGNCGADAGQAVGHVHFHFLGGRKFTWPPG